MAHLAARCTSSVRCSANAAGVDNNAKDQRVVLITGGNTGLGFESAKKLASQGYNILLGCRDNAKGQSARARLQSEVSRCPEIDVVVFDLADLSSVRDFGKRAQDSNMKIDVLLNNAGVMACPEMRTRDGFEYQLGVNHLGHFLLTSMLLPLLQSSSSGSSTGQRSRIVNVASAAHFFGTMNFEDLNYNRPESYDRWRAYGQSKLANILFTNELARRLPLNGTGGTGGGITVNTLHPGVVATELGRFLLPDGGESGSWLQKPLVAAAKMFALTPQQGAETNVFLVSSPEVENVTGEYFDKCKPAKRSKEAKDFAVGAKLWEMSEELVGVKGGVTVGASV